MTEPDPRSAGQITGRSRPPLWLRLSGCLVPLVIAATLAARRGVVAGIAAAVVFGLILLFGLGWGRMRAWSERHPLLDRLIVVPLLVPAVAYLAQLPVVFCVLLALVVGVPVAALGLGRLRTRRRNGS